jgi:hypothetical protein
VWLGCFEDGQLQVAEPAVIMVNQGEVHCKTLLHGRVQASLGHAVPVGLVGELLANLGAVVLAMGVRHMGQPFGTFPLDYGSETELRGLMMP